MLSLPHVPSMLPAPYEGQLKSQKELAAFMCQENLNGLGLLL